MSAAPKPIAPNPNKPPPSTPSKPNTSTKPSTAATTTTNPTATPGAPKSSSDKDLSDALRKLETKTKAVNANNIARVSNAKLLSADDRLAPLVSLKTGKAIDKFPETSGKINKLGVTVIDAILSALEADRTGKEEEKRERLRVQIGLPANPA